MNYMKTGLLLILMGLMFVYGIAIGRYQVFPYTQLSELTNWVRGIETDGPDYGDVNVIESSLHRLFVKSIEVEEDHSGQLHFHGGAIEGKGPFLYIISNRNDEHKDRFVVFNVEQYNRVETAGLSVPMNVEGLLSSSIMDIDGFRMDRFRVNGIHVEETGDSEHTLYVTHNTYHEDENCISYRVSRITVEYNDLELRPLTDWETLHTASPCLYPEEDQKVFDPFPGEMGGGAIVEYDDDHLLVSVGSFHRDGFTFEPSLSMDTSSTFGKTLLMNKQTGDYSVYAKGLRNTQGIAIDAEGRIWATDHGPHGGDELNLIKQGKNFGWPEVTYGIDYGNNPWPYANEQGRHDDHEKPRFVWMNSIAPSSIITVEGTEKFPLWRGDLLVGAMGAAGGRSLYRLRIQDDDRIIYNERIILRERVRDMTSLSDGTIALLADGGLLLLIDDGGPTYEEIGPVAEARIEALRNFDQLKGEGAGIERDDREMAGQSIFMQNCSSCHYLQEVNGAGPHLKDIFDRQIGDADGFNYSRALASRDDSWTPALMKSFLLNPSDQFPNNNMLQVPLTEEETNKIIEFLRNN
jgi:aldose sugar dehydrogenase